MADWYFQVTTANDLDLKIRERITALDNLSRDDEVHGTVHIEYSDETVKKASLIPWLQNRGVAIEWQKKPG
jgi:hypothetical protein